MPMPNDKEKELEGIASLQSFFDQFGPNDIYKQIFLEELFKFIYDEMDKKSDFIDPSCDNEPSL